MANAVSAAEVDIYGGDIDAKSIAASGDVTIVRGKVKAAPTGGGIDAIAAGGNVTISGGQVTATGTKNDIACGSSGAISLGWTDASDFIAATEYDGSVSVAEGDYFVDNSGAYFYGSVAKTIDTKLSPANVYVNDSIANGGIVPSPYRADANATVTLTVNPDSGYELTALSVTQGGAKTDLTVTKGATSYTFTKGTGNAVVNATFKRSIAPVVEITGWMYGETANNPGVTDASNPGGGAPTYVYYTDANCTTRTTAADHGASAEGEKPVYAGACYVKADVPETESYASGTGVASFTIAQRSVTLTSATAERDYNGAALTDSTVSVTGDGWATGEGASYDVTGTQTLPGSSTNTFTYTLNDGTLAGNYTITVVEGTLTVKNRTNKYQITVTANGDDTPVYDGQKHSVSGYTIDPQTLKFDGVTYVLSGLSASAEGTNVGTYTAKVQGTAVVKVEGGTVNLVDQFAITLVDSALVINPAEVTVTAADKTKTYGDADPTLTATVEGLVEGEAESLISYSLAREAGEDVKAGGYEITASGDKDQGNYSVSLSGVLTIEQADVTVTAVDKTKTYGNDDPTLTATVDGLKRGDKESVISYTLARDGTKTTAGQNVGNYDIVPSGQQSQGNYNVAFVKGKLTIGQRSVKVTITGHNSTADYDGKAHTVSGYDATPGDTLYKTSDIAFSGTAKASRKDAGTAAMGLAASQFSNTNGNFAVTFEVTDGYQTVESIDATVTIVGANNTTDYDGQAHTVEGYTATASTALYDVNSDFTFSGTAKAERTDAGTTAMGLTASQFANINGNFNTVTFEVTDGYQTVEPIDVTVTIVGANNTADYDGKAHTVEGYTATASTALYDVNSDFTFSGTAKAERTDAGTTAMGLVASQFANTNGNFNTVTFEVTDGYQTVESIPVTVDVTGHSDTVVYDGKEHVATGYDLSFSDSLYTADDITFTGTAKAGRTDAGTTAMGLAAAQFANDSANFDPVTFNVTDGSLTIERAAATVTADSLTKTYGEADPALTATVTGLAAGDALTYTLSREAVEGVGTYAITVEGDAEQGSYTVSYESGALTIEKAAIEPVLRVAVAELDGKGTLVYKDRATWTYGDTASTWFVDGNDGSGEAYLTDGDGVRLEGLPTEAGKYTLRAIVPETTNHLSATTAAVTVTIEKAKHDDITMDKPVTVSAGGVSDATVDLSAYLTGSEGCKVERVDGELIVSASVSVDGMITYTAAQDQDGVTGSVTLHVSGGNYEDYRLTVPFRTAEALVLSFDANGGNQILSRRLRQGAAYGELPEAVREGYDFGGWFADAALTKPVTAETLMGAADATVYAKWTLKTYAVTLNLNGHGTLNGVEWPKDVTVTATQTGATLTFSVEAQAFDLPTLANDNGSTFGGWSDGSYVGPVTIDPAEMQGGAYTAEWSEGVKEGSVILELSELIGLLGIKGMTSDHSSTDGSAPDSTLADQMKAIAIMLSTPAEADKIVKVEMHVSTGNPNQQAVTRFRRLTKNLLECFDIFIEKVVTSIDAASGAEKSTATAITETPEVLEIQLRYDLTGRYNISVYRDHDGQAQAFRRIGRRPGVKKIGWTARSSCRAPAATRFSTSTPAGSPPTPSPTPISRPGA